MLLCCSREHHGSLPLSDLLAPDLQDNDEHKRCPGNASLDGEDLSGAWSPD